MIVGEEGHATSISDGELELIIAVESEVEIFIADKNKTKAGGSLFPCINNTIYDLSKYGIFKKVDRNNNHKSGLYCVDILTNVIFELDAKTNAFYNYLCWQNFFYFI